MPSRSRGTAYGIMNMGGLFIGAAATNLLGWLGDNGRMALGFGCMAGAVLLALIVQLTVLRPTTLDMK